MGKKSPAAQGSSGKGPGIHAQNLGFSFWIEGFYLGREWLLACLQDGRGSFLHLPGNLPRVGSGVLEKEVQHWVARSPASGASQHRGGHPFALQVVVLELLIIGLLVSHNTIDSYFITLTQLTPTVVLITRK